MIATPSQEAPRQECNYTCDDVVFQEIATLTGGYLRDEDKEEILCALHLTWHSPAISDFERATLRRTATLLELAWNEGWRQLCTRGNPNTRRIFDALPPLTEDLWRHAQENKEEHETLLLRGATHLRYMQQALNDRIALPFPSWLEMSGELCSRECHWTLHNRARDASGPSAEAYGR